MSIATHMVGVRANFDPFWYVRFLNKGFFGSLRFFIRIIEQNITGSSILLFHSKILILIFTRRHRLYVVPNNVKSFVFFV